MQNFSMKMCSFDKGKRHKWPIVLVDTLKDYMYVYVTKPTILCIFKPKIMNSSQCPEQRKGEGCLSGVIYNRSNCSRILIGSYL